MVDEKNTQEDSTIAASNVDIKPAKARKARAKIASVVAEKATPKRKKYTPQERASILSSIEGAIKNGKTTLKAALLQAAVSEQTYYNWKNAAQKNAPTPVKVSSSDDLTSLLALEAENLKLRKELATKLREENAELRRRLGKQK